MRIVINKKYRLISILGVIATCMPYSLQSLRYHMLEYIGSVNRYLPRHVKNGIVLLLCSFESIINLVICCLVTNDPLVSFLHFV